MSLPHGLSLIASLSRLTPYSSNTKPGPTGGKIRTDKFRLEVLGHATLQIPPKKLGAMKDIAASGDVPAHKHLDIANVQVHVYDGVEISEDGATTGQIEINARSVTPSWADSERRVHLSVNVKPASGTGAPTALVLAYADKRPEIAAASDYGPDSKGGNVLVTPL